ncbi:TonB-dependent receptor [Chitinophaga parva]|uniref:TonB-dependent receptor n=1 Tax=Chitinophaga parva TaxID=2169414 RepID=A0A2T7BER5_9BACT|nr:TonB-dependent receptor [Chitinophaga parva]PUZ24776.1 TonB-dependent receptor [Chitinophaga parva]
MKRFLIYGILFMMTLLAAVPAAFAQGVTTASFSGVIRDTKGGAIPGATVVVTHEPTGTKYNTISRADGRFNIPDVRVGGPYSIKITYIGYQDFSQQNITTSIGEDYKVNTKLEEASTALKELVVTGKQDKVMNTSRTGARETVTRAQIDQLPTLNRSLQDFTKLTPSANGLNFGGRSNLYNNITVDGALFNNSFGLSGTLGGQTSSQPISLDAIDQIQVDLAPFDVRQGFFTGAGVNSVVKSGTNDFKGSVYTYIRSTGLTGYNAGGTKVNKVPFDYNTRGASIGGPIIKNKLFFFVSGEQERISNVPTTYVAGRSGASGNVSQVQATTLDSLSQFLQKNYGYNPGAYENYNYKTQSDKLTVKLDWNLNQKNTFSLKYFYFKSFKDQPASNSGITNSKVGYGTSRAPGLSTLPFFGSGYRINNNFNIVIGELNTRFSNSVHNKLTVGYSALRDFRSSLGNKEVPMVDIGNGTYDPVSGKKTNATATLTSFGYELYTAGNKLNTNTFQFSDDVTWYAGKNEFVVGTSNQVNSYLNGFAPDYNGLYTFNSPQEFMLGMPAMAYTYRNSVKGAFPYAKISSTNLSVYIQDKYSVTDNFKLTAGIRADYAIFPTTLDENPAVAALKFDQGLTGIDVSKLPKSNVLISPRVGFNWDVDGKHNTQVRGGAGLFSGVVPYVWISNQASNTGTLFSSGTVTYAATPADNRLIFNADVNHNRPTGPIAANTSYEVDVASRDFKYPQVARFNAAVDQKLPWGIIGTIEAVYTKDLQAVYHQNIALPDTYTTLSGPEGQIRYTSNTLFPSVNGGLGNTITNPNINNAIYMRNTKKGYAYFGTIQLQKNFQGGFYANVAYTYSQAKDVNDGGSTASTIWSTRPIVGNPNANVLGNASYIQPHRVIASFSYRKEYAKNFATSAGLVWEMANNGAVSYITSGDPNGDGGTNDLMYIPKAKGDITLVPDANANPASADEQWNQLDNFIKQDKYLSKHRGQFAQRNAVILPYFKRADLNITQDFYLKQANGRRHTLRVTLDIINVGNLLNHNWGLYDYTYNGFNSGTISLMKFEGVVADGKGGQQATYNFPLANVKAGTPNTYSFKTNPDQISRWQGQIGIRYIFN